MQQILDNISHHNLRVVRRHGAAYGDDISLTSVFITELAQLHNWYPLFFRQEQDGQFAMVALLGFTPQQNLFLQQEQWQAGYVPLSIRRQPFLIGQQQQFVNGVPQQQAVVCIDTAHPRVSLTDGEPLFLPDGGQSPLLQQITAVLQQIEQGHLASQQFCRQLQALELLTPLTLELTLPQGPHRVAGLHTLDEARLHALSAQQLYQLQQQGLLKAIYLLLASQANISRMLNQHSGAQ